MNKTLYNTAMDKVTMSDECLGEILDSIDEVQTIPEMKKKKKVRYIQVLTAAVVFIFGSITVAAETGGLEWINRLFKDEEVMLSFYDMAAEIEDFKCESNYNIKLSPVGILCDEQDFFAIFHIDNLPDNLKGEFLGYHVDGEIGRKYGSFGYSFSNDFDSEKNDIILKITTPQRVFKDGENIKLNLWYHEYEDTNYHKEILTLQNLAEISFTLRLGEFDSLNINYKEYMPDFIPQRDYDFLFDEINITPFSITTHGRLYFYADVMLSDDLTIIFSDGTEWTSEGGCSSCTGGSATSEDSLYANYYDSTIVFDEPIDPNSVTEIYLGDMLIYRK